MFKDERELIRRFVESYKINQRALELRKLNRLAMSLYVFWALVMSQVFFNSIALVPITLILFLPSLFFLLEYVKIYKIIQIQERVKYLFEQVASLLKGGFIIDNALVKTFEDSIKDEMYPVGLREIFKSLSHKLRFNMADKYSLKAIGDYAKIPTISRIDWICDYCIKSGLEIESVFLQVARTLGRQQIYRRALLQKLNSKQQEFILMLVAPIFVKIGTQAMMKDFFTTGSKSLSEIGLGVVLTVLYSVACSLYLATNNHMLRGTYENT